jgi:enoyl-CoA hydratase/carnithine racemase
MTMDKKMTEYTHLEWQIDNGIGRLTLNRPEKKNAINDALCLEIEDVFRNLDSAVRVIILSGNGSVFCSGLDLSEHTAREPFEVVNHSRMWHRTFGHIRNSGIPVIAAMHGAVIGGGLELAANAHIRIAEQGTFYRLPEGRHGIFVGGGASVTVGKIIGIGRMTEMMLTGRTLDTNEGQTYGLSHYIVEQNQSLSKAEELAEIVGSNSPYSNWAMTTGLNRINSMSDDDGLYTESLLTGMTQTSGEVKERIDKFLNRKKES